MGRSISSDSSDSPIKYVVSEEGFGVGDLIYQTSGKVGVIPDDFTAQALFSATSNDPLNITNDTSNSSSKFVFPINSTVRRSFGVGKPAAVLSNGNVVTVYMGTTNTGTSNFYKDIFFRIDQPDGTSVVSETQVNSASDSMRIYENCCLTVVASSAGGFMVAWLGSSSGYPTFRIYADNGTAYGVDRQHGVAARFLRAETFNEAPSSSARFAVMHVNSSNVTYLSIVNSSGEQTTPTVSSSIGFNSNADVCSTSDGKVHVIYSQSNQLYRKSYNNAGSQLISESINSSAGTIFEVACASTPNDKIGFYRKTNAALEYSYTLDGTTSGGWTPYVQITSPPNTAGSPAFNVDYLGSIAGTENFFYSATFFWVNYSGAINYEGEAIGPRLTNFIRQSGGGSFAFIKAGTEYRAYASAGGTTGNEYRFYGIPNSRPMYTKINSLFAPDGENSVSQVVATTSSLVNGYIKGSSIPSGAKFYASSNSTINGNLPETTDSATYVQGPEDLSFQAYYMKGLELDNGKIAILYVINTCDVYLKILTSTYATESTTLIKTSNSSAGRYKIDMKRFSDGKILIVYPASTSYTTILGRVYSSTMTLLVPETEIAISNTQYSDNSALSVAPFPFAGNNNFVLTYKASNQFYYSEVFSGTDFSQLFGPEIVNGASGAMSGSYSSVAFSNQGILYHTYTSASGGSRLSRALVNSSTSQVTSWSQLKNDGATNYTRRNSEIIIDSGGTLLVPYAESSGQDSLWRVSGTASQDITGMSLSRGHSNFYGQLNGITGNGQWFIFQQVNLTDGGQLNLVAAAKGENSYRAIGLIAPVQGANDQTLAGCVIPSRGSAAHIIYNKPSSNHSIFKIRPYGAAYVLKTETGVTASDVVALNANNAALLGVASSDCSPNGTGIIQTTGSVAINNNYSTASESFDFRSNTANGVKGSINGRNLSLGD